MKTRRYSEARIFRILQEVEDVKKWLENRPLSQEMGENAKRYVERSMM
ncbi:hypothetical protein ACFLW8_04310 [Chloroflexota bacterium]